MLKDNIKSLRESKGISQEELATQLHVVRQTISKWERGSSIPDARMLVKLAEALNTSTSVLLEEKSPQPKDCNLESLSEKLNSLSLQLTKKRNQHRKIVRWILISLCIIIVLVFIVLFFFLKSPYLNWDYDNLENAVLGVGFHALEWIFVRIAPILLIGSIIGIVLTYKKV